MTFNTKIEVFYRFLAILVCEIIQEQIAPKSIEIDKDKLCTKF